MATGGGDKTFSPSHRQDPATSYKPRPVSEDQPLEGSLHFTINKHPKESLDIMNILRQSNKLCDVVLTVGDDKIPAHKVVLSAASPYFKAMFTGGMRETDMTTIPLHGIHPCILAKLVEFAYTAEITVNEMNVCNMLPAAMMFQMSHIVDACCTFLEHQLHPSNCLGIAEFAHEHGCNSLFQKAREYIYEHFTELAQHDEFKLLSFSGLIQLIKRDELNVKCESEVYKAVIEWVRYDEEKRLIKLESLVCSVRCSFLAPHFLREQIKNCPILKKQKPSVEYLSQVFKDLTLHKRLDEKQRHPRCPPVIYCAGGYLRHSLPNFDSFSPEVNSWCKLSGLPLPRSGLSACMLHGRFYAVGGRNNSPDGNVDSGCVDCYDPAINKWTRCKDLGVPRNRVGVGVIDGYLYAVGGSHGSIHHNSVERYDPDKDEWTPVAPMSVKRIGVGVAVVNRLLYAVGGFDGQNRLRSVECYYPEDNKWQMVSPMNVTRSGAAVVDMDQYIYAVGGYDSNNQLRTVERYDSETDKWEFVKPMNSPRSALSGAVLNGKVYALGGYDGNDFLNSVEVYDPTDNEWTDGVSMSCGRSGHAVSVGTEPYLGTGFRVRQTTGYSGCRMSSSPSRESGINDKDH